MKKLFLKNSQKSQENTCTRVSILIKLQAAPATLLKKRFWHRCFPVNFAKFLRIPFLQNTSARLLLYWTQLFCLFSDQIMLLFSTLCRSSYWRCFIKKGVLKNFTKFTGKQLCQSLFLNKVAGWCLQLY